MKSYSKIFKASHVSLVNETKVISSPFPVLDLPDREETTEGNLDSFTEHYQQLGSQLTEKAEAQAKAIIAEAEKNAQTIEADVQEKMNLWWEENQVKLEALSLEANQLGYNDGFAKGEADAKQQLEQEYQEKLAQAQALIQQAYEQKKAIIAEAEPFLLELSTAIASQIIRQELEGNPEIFVELIKQHILRFKEKESITVCVHPDDYDFIQSQRSHLVAVVNGETEIKIIPDPAVTPKGCIIRTAYGSVDARIDTQLEEIKKVILEAGSDLDSETIN